jgi:CDP-paratose 2-epimerase
MRAAIVTGAAGLVGSATARRFAAIGLKVIGVDNDQRAVFFGPEASTAFSRARLEEEVPGYEHRAVDVRDREGIDRVFAEFGSDVAVVVHAAAQPSHDWAATDPFADFSVNATGTLSVLEATRLRCPDAAFVFTSTNKVYGDAPNRLPLRKLDSRFEIDEAHAYFEHGIDESMSIDASLHSVFGASKVAADVMTQEYGRYFGLKTAVFRGGCLTGPGHAGVELHGFLSYLMRCVMSGRPYVVYGHGGLQVRDNIHADDLVSAFEAFYRAPRKGEVYNVGGGRFANCSVKEAIALCEEIAGKKIVASFSDRARVGDHLWWISDMSRFRAHYPDWAPRRDLRSTLVEIRDELARRGVA